MILLSGDPRLIAKRGEMLGKSSNGADAPAGNRDAFGGMPDGVLRLFVEIELLDAEHFARL